MSAAAAPCNASVSPCLRGEDSAVVTWVLAWAAVRDELRQRCNLSGRKMEWCDQARLLRVLNCSHAFCWSVQSHYNKRRGVNLPFSPQDWLLLNEWREDGIWLGAIERGIDVMFYKRDRARRFEAQYSGASPMKREINSLAYCEQVILKMQEKMMEAAVGSYEYHGDYEPHRRPHTLLLALPPGRPMFQALQSQRQVDAVADAFQVGIVFTVAPDDYRKHQARERFGIELEFLDEHVSGPDSLFLSGSGRLAGSAPRSGGAGSRQPFSSDHPITRSPDVPISPEAL